MSPQEPLETSSPVRPSAFQTRYVRIRKAYRHFMAIGLVERRRAEGRAVDLWRRSDQAFPEVTSRLRKGWEILKKYYYDDCFSYAAGLSFWFIVSVVPLSSLLFRLLGLILGTGAYAEATQRTLETIVPFLPKSFVKDAIRNSQQLRGLWLSVPVLLFGSYWGIAQLDTSLAHVFGLRIEKRRQTRKNPMLRQLSFLVGGTVVMVLFMALLVGTALSRHMPIAQSTYLPFLSPLLSLGVLTVMLQHLPRRHVAWRHAFVGAAVSTGLWWGAKWGFGVYLSHTFTWGIMYGSMLSMIAGLTFLYYSCAIFLLGAEITAAFYPPSPGASGSGKA